MKHAVIIALQVLGGIAFAYLWLKGMAALMDAMR